MAMNNNCNCGYNPCQCHTVCRPPVACIPSPPSIKPKPPTITVEGLLKLIDEKCDKETCGLLQVEIELLYLLLGLEDHKPSKPPVPGQPLPKPPVNKPLPDMAFQLVSNMVESLAGDLKDKYPSAALLKAQLKALWTCMYNKQEHHGMWKDNFTTRDVIPTEDMCLLDGQADGPKTIKVITPVDVGSTVFHIIEGKKCLFESLVDNNITEPSKLSVLEGKWINYCDIKAVIDCVLPRQIITNCKDKCDDPNKDGVHEGKTMCQRMEAVEAYMKAHP